ncbi:MAG TPA: amino acid adenylation domain-containing protein [Thermoanaerobaculia bacterium]|nr:amino acid adenylation domain-containing protein [Thermoanaerobaculia bacterium]
MTSTAELSDKRQLLLEKLLRKQGVATGARPAIPRRAGSGPAPLSFGQQRLWFLHQLEPAGTAYNLAEAVRLRGRLDAGALERALAEVVRRHEVLRTVYATVDGEPRQIVQPAVPLPLPRVRLSGLPAPIREAEAGGAASALAGQPFDLARGSMLRSALLELDRDDHVLLLVLHHIAADGWSLGLLVRELTALYDAFAAGAPSPLPEPPLQYADFAAWQRGWLQGETLEAQLRYWRERLAGAPTQLALPVDRPWPAVQTTRGDRAPILVGAEIAAALRELARERGATLFMVLAGGLAALLGRITGQDDLLLGTPTAGRGRPEIEGLIGFFINTLVLRADLSGDPDVPALLARLKETVLGADAHQDLPFERLIDALELPRDLSRTPLFQVMLAFQNLPPADERPGALAVQPFPFVNRRAQFELQVSLIDAPQGLFGSLEYRTELFDAPSAGRLVRQLDILLAGIARDPRRPVSQLPLLSPAEEQQLVHEWNDTATAYAWPRERGGLHHLIEAQVARTPGAVAASFEGESLTYAGLDARANRLARHLRSLGCGPETRVGVVLERSLELMVALLGILKSGAAYVPLDPEYPADRLAFMLDDARPAVLLTEERLLPVLPETSAPVLCLHPDGRESLDHGSAAPDEPAADLQLAYVIYTSGSTGRPKGAMVHHAGIRNRLLWMQEAYGLGPADTVLQKTPYSFDVSVWEFFWPLLAGARVAFARPGEHRDAAALAARIAAEGTTVLHFVPSMLQVFLEEPGIDGCRSLRRVVASGEALTPELVHRFHERLPGVALENLYGPTEASVDVTFQPCPPGGGARAVPIGRPIANTRIHLMDRAGRPVPAGVAGELWIGGVNVGRGYLGRPDLTAEKFVPDPRGDGSRVYRTGDLARHRPDGAVEYLGRIDHQVKLRGVRIELGEIESALLRHPGVREAAVVMRQDRGVRRLVGYVAPAAAARPDELRSSLLERLPEAMVPTLFVGLATLPLSPNGKLDRRALPAPDPGAQSEAYEPPETVSEEILAGLWAEILGLDRVGMRDNFFALGGDSILSIRLLARARDAGMSLTLQQVFQHQTVRDLARVLGAEAEPPVHTAPFDLVTAEDRARMPAGVEDAYPLARLQAGMLYHSELAPETAVYHDVFSLHLRAPWDEDALRRAVDSLVARHPILRTSFDMTSFREPLQLVWERIETPFAAEDLRHLPEAEQETAVAAWLDTERRRRFDWSQAPLVHVHAHRRGEDTFQFTLSFHHSTLDGWSAATLQTELFRRYFAEREGTAPPTEPPPASAYRDFVALEQAALGSAASRGFWRGLLDGAEATRLPRGPVPSVEVPRSRELRVAPPPEVAEEVRRLARRAGVPLKSAFLASHLAALGFLAGQSDVLTGMVANGRPEGAGGDQVLGLFLNMLPFRLRLGDESWEGLVRATFDAERAMLPHRRFPLAELQAANAGTPLFEIAFNFVHFHVYQGVQDLGQATGVSVLGDFGYEEVDFPLGINFQLDPSGTHLALRLNYLDSELSGEQAAAVAGTYLRVLAAMAAEPARPHRQVSFLSDAERAQLLAWGRSEPLPAATAPVHEQVAAQAARTPEAVALRADGVELTYAQLDARANRLAHHLRGLGVVPGSLVGVLLDRTVDLPTALLGIWKAGGASLPLDPAHPDERLAFLLADSGARLVITEPGLALRVTAPGAVTVVAADVPASAPGHDPGPAAGPEDLAYAIYTSGSTGRPKGVLVEHRQLAATLAASQREFGWRAGDVMPCLAPFAFDISLFELLNPLLAGGTAVLFGLRPTLDLPELVARLGELTHLHSVPSLMRQIVAAVRAEGREGGYPQLRTLFVGGDAVPSDLLPEMRRAFPAADIRILYGPTEGTIICTSYRVPEAAAAPRPLLGRPLPGAEIQLRDAAGRLVPAGATGEIRIGGAGVTRGYLGLPELTAERYPEEQGRRFYRTGDLARWLPDGELEFLGRADDQVKIRGIRVELGEVEAALAAHPGVAEAVAAARTDAGGDRQLVAWLVARGPEPSAAELRELLRGRLPEAMVPSAFVFLPALPLSPNGKVDRRALPDPDRSETGGRPEYAAPRTPIEERLAALWSEVLKVERVGLHDSFLELGGQSLLAMQLITKLRAAFEVELPLRALYEAPDLEALAAAVADAGAAVSEVPSLPEGPVDRFAPVPLTPAQEAFWIGGSGLFDLGGCASNVYLEYEFPGAVWPFADSLNQILRKVIDRHEMLRTVVLPDGTQQLLATVPPFEVEAEDLSDRKPEWIENRLAEVRDELRYARRPPDRWPLFEIVIHQIQDGLLRLHARFDALLMDGTARGVLLNELFPLLIDQDAEVPPLPVSFLDHARALAAFRNTRSWARSRAYWMERLPTLPPAPRLPVTQPLSPALVPRIVKRQVKSLAPEPWAALKQRAGRLGISPTGILVAAFAEVLRPWSPEPGFSLGMGGSNRLPIHPEIQRVIGSFTTLHVLAVENVPGSFAGRARALQSRLVADLEHQQFAGHHVLRELNRLRGTGTRAALPVHFNSVVEYGANANRAAAEAAEATEAGEEPVQSAYRLDLTEIDLMISLPQVLLLWVALESPAGELELVSQAVEEVLPAEWVPSLLDDYGRLLERLAAEDAAWREERPVAHSAALDIAAPPPPPEPAEPAGPARGPEAWDAEEAALAGLWESVLGRRPTASTDEFFALGGDSLLAVRLLGPLRERWGDGLPLAELFVRPDLAGMAAAVRRGRPRSKTSLLQKLTGWARRTPATAGSPVAGASPTRRSS